MKVLLTAFYKSLCRWIIRQTRSHTHEALVGSFGKQNISCVMTWMWWCGIFFVAVRPSKRGVWIHFVAGVQVEAQRPAFVHVLMFSIWELKLKAPSSISVFLNHVMRTSTLFRGCCWEVWVSTPLCLFPSSMCVPGKWLSQEQTPFFSSRWEGLN